jgi:hypothetical protein
MTNIIRHPFAAPQPFDETRLKAALRALKPFTPALSMALYRVFDRHQEFALAYEQYVRDAALTGLADRSRLDRILPEFAQARRDALIAMGADPESTDIFPAVPAPRR